MNVVNRQKASFYRPVSTLPPARKTREFKPLSSLPSLPAPPPPAPPVSVSPRSAATGYSRNRQSKPFAAKERSHAKSHLKQQLALCGWEEEKKIQAEHLFEELLRLLG